MAGEYATPLGVQSGPFARALTGPSFPALLARLGARFAGLWGGAVKFGGWIVVARHADIVAVLSRDLQFRIGPINAARIGAVNGGPFVLGMDRGATLARERAALYRALAKVDLETLHRRVEADASARIAGAGRGIDVVGDYARPVAAATATALFGVAGPNPADFMDAARAVFAHTFLNLSNDATIRERGERAGEAMRCWLENEIGTRHGPVRPVVDMMDALLADGMLDGEGVRRTLGGMLIGSIDTTASSVARIIAVLGCDPELAARVAADVDDRPRLAGWCREALRLWPHNPILLREAAEPGTLAGVAVAPGDRIVLWTQAAMCDPAVFPDPSRLDPGRPTEGYLHFGGGLHPCAGRTVNAFQIPALVGALVRRGIASVGPIHWAGPFPHELTVTFRR